MQRGGYTLLEVMLAFAIGLLLVAALYVALNVQMHYMQTGRNAVAEGQLARGVLQRMAADIRANMGRLPAARSASTTSTATTAPTTAPTTPTSTSSPSSTSGGTPATSATLGTAQFNYGIQGDETQLMLFVSAVPRHGRGSADSQTGESDLRRIVYMLLPGSGLARIESRTFSTYADDLADATPDILAQEVISLGFRYYDGSSASWLTSWDGTTTGPPLAVEITLGLQPPMDIVSPRFETPPPTYYRKVVAIPTATITTSDTSSTTTTTTP